MVTCNRLFPVTIHIYMYSLQYSRNIQRHFSLIHLNIRKFPYEKNRNYFSLQNIIKYRECLQQSIFITFCLSIESQCVVATIKLIGAKNFFTCLGLPTTKFSGPYIQTIKSGQYQSTLVHFPYRHFQALSKPFILGHSHIHFPIQLEYRGTKLRNSLISVDASLKQFV